MLLKRARVALFLLLVGCQGEETSLQLRFLLDPTLNTEEQLLAAIDTLDLILDASEGFSGVTETGSAFGELTAWDVDGDDVAELILRRTVEGARDLPRLRLLPGSNLGRAFKITARGWKDDQIVAVGGISSARFEPGVHKDLDLPFNLRAAFRPPRVVIVLPHDGQSVPRALSQVYVEFSKPVPLPPAAGPLRVVYESAPNAPVVPGEWLLADNTVQDLGMPEVRTTATLVVDASCSLNPGTFRIEASTQITDRAGTRLDQDAATADADPFVSRFAIPGAPTDRPCGSISQTCREDNDCFAYADAATQGFVCLIAPGQSEGKCVPGTGDCGGLFCGDGYVCTILGEKAACVQDCRIFGCGLNTECDPNSGLCQDKCLDPNSCNLPPADECIEKCMELCGQQPETCESCFKQCG